MGIVRAKQPIAFSNSSYSRLSARNPTSNRVSEVSLPSNAATVRLSEAVGRDNVMRAARDLGITTELPDKPSIALGTAGVSLLELTSAYAAVASANFAQYCP